MFSRTIAFLSQAEGLASNWLAGNIASQEGRNEIVVEGLFRVEQCGCLLFSTRSQTRTDGLATSNGTFVRQTRHVAIAQATERLQDEQRLTLPIGSASVQKSGIERSWTNSGADLMTKCRPGWVGTRRRVRQRAHPSDNHSHKESP